MSKNIFPKFKNGGRQYGVQTPPTNAFSFFGEHRNTPDIHIRRTLGPTDRANANLEAEKNETVITNLQGEGLPEFYTIGGKPHSKGGTPLNLPDESFFFSQTPGMKISDPNILNIFGKKGTKAYTPAELSKQYDLNVYREILMDPSSSKRERETAELMIKNYVDKLGALALAQESQKGFEKGIPLVAMGYVEKMGLNPMDLLPQQQPMMQMQQQPQFKLGGGLPKFQNGDPVKNLTIDQVRTKYKLGDDVTIYDASDPNYDPSVVKKGDYVIKDNKLVQYSTKQASNYADKISKEDAAKYGNYAQGTYLMNQKFQDPKFKQEVVTKFWENVEKSHKDGYLKDEQYNRLINYKNSDKYSDDALVKVFAGYSNGLFELSNSGKHKPGEKNSSLNITEELKALGYNNVNPTTTAIFQGMYYSLSQLKDSKEWKDYLGDIEFHQVGNYDEKLTGKKEGSISKIDGIPGDTTVGQMFSIAKDVPAYVDVTEPEAIKHLVDTHKEAPARWWTQDLVNMGNAVGNYLSQEKYTPWMDKPQHFEAQPQFTDFRGAASRIGAQGTGLGNLAMQYADPGTAAAIFNNIQARSVEGLQRLQEGEQQYNVGIQNQFNQMNAQSRNQYEQALANINTNLYDKNTILNQQFDNTKRALAQNMVNTFNNGWTNRGKTQVMNSLNDNYKINPITGMLEFTDTGRMIQPAQSKKTILDMYNGLLEQGVTKDDAIALLKLSSGQYNDGYPQGLNQTQAYPTL